MSDYGGDDGYDAGGYNEYGPSIFCAGGCLYALSGKSS